MSRINNNKPIIAQRSCDRFDSIVDGFTESLQGSVNPAALVVT